MQKPNYELQEPPLWSCVQHDRRCMQSLSHSRRTSNLSTAAQFLDATADYRQWFSFGSAVKNTQPLTSGYAFGHSDRTEQQKRDSGDTKAGKCRQLDLNRERCASATNA